MASQYKDFLDAVLTECRAQETTGRVTDSSQIIRLDWDDIQRLKGFNICWTRPQTHGVIHSRDDRAYPCHLILVRGGRSGGWDEEATYHQDLFEKLRRHFHDKRPFASSVAKTGSSLLPCRVTEGSVPAGVKEKNDVHHLIVWCWIRETRNAP